MNRSIRKATAATINSQVCSGRKEMACPAVLKMRITVELMSPGKLDAVFLPIPFRTFPMRLLSVCYRPYNSANDSRGSKDSGSDSDAIILSISLMRSPSESVLSHWQAGPAVAFFRGFFTSSLMVSGCFIFDLCNFQILLDFSVKFRIFDNFFVELPPTSLAREMFYYCFWQREVYLSIFREKCSFASFMASNHKFSIFGTFPLFEMSKVRNLPSLPYSAQKKRWEMKILHKNTDKH